MIYLLLIFIFLLNFHSFSGTTAICGMIRGKELYVANVGDSRAVAGTLAEGDRVIQVKLLDKLGSIISRSDTIQRCNWIFLI